MKIFWSPAWGFCDHHPKLLPAAKSPSSFRCPPLRHAAAGHLVSHLLPGPPTSSPTIYVLRFASIYSRSSAVHFDVIRPFRLGVLLQLSWPWPPVTVGGEISP
ncbi:uncharacterized protein LOC124693394 [Lolium rigidum]|uniref:uncharacterized protein LOC124693394 n=1 Tax=Lolium rigidum TaxID=89674 RepID=UPI001F5E27E2|nr:uncharacterized protein LOC124693394 [Lolium rigidum]